MQSFNRTFANRPGEPAFKNLTGISVKKVSIAPLRTGPANLLSGRLPRCGRRFNRTFANRPGEPFGHQRGFAHESPQTCFNRTFANRPGEPGTAAHIDAVGGYSKFQSHLCEPARRTQLLSGRGFGNSLLVSIAPLRTGPANRPDTTCSNLLAAPSFNRTFANRPGEPRAASLPNCSISVNSFQSHLCEPARRTSPCSAT